MNEELWAELTAHSRRMARIEKALTERIITLEAEVRALKGEPGATREVYPDAQPINWRHAGTAGKVIDQIMQK